MFITVITVPITTKGKQGERKYDKKYSCFLCNKEFGKLPRHLFQTHGDNEEVMEILSLNKEIPKEEKLRIHLLDALRLKGDFFHNLRVLHFGGELKLLRRPNYENNWTYRDFTPCPHCLGFVLKYELWRHNINCQFKDKARNIPKFGRLQAESEMLLFTSMEKPSQSFMELKDTILSSMKSDDVSSLVRRDDVILDYGSFLMSSSGVEKAIFISQKMRQLGRLVLCYREKNDCSEYLLADLLKPERFDEVVAVTKELCSFQHGEQLPSFKTPSLALKLGISLKKCAILHKGVALRRKDKGMLEDLEFFKQLVETEWSHRISSVALRTLADNKFNKIEILPVTDDLLKLKEFLLNEINTKTAKLRVSPDLELWRDLANAVVSRLIIFNKRRCNEAAKITVDQFRDRPSWNEETIEEVSSSLMPLEIELSKRYKSLFCWQFQLQLHSGQANNLFGHLIVAALNFSIIYKLSSLWKTLTILRNALGKYNYFSA